MLLSASMPCINDEQSTYCARSWAQSNTRIGCDAFSENVTQGTHEQRLAEALRKRETVGEVNTGRFVLPGRPGKRGVPMQHAPQHATH